MRALPDIRLFSGLTATAAAVALVLLPPPVGGDAQAAGAGDSAVTVQGREGTHDDFSDLKVTVDQTAGLRSQGVRVSWTGGAPSERYDRNYLQIMQCWGDDPSGPRREQCQFGQSGLTELGFGSSRTVGFGEESAEHDPGETEYPATVGTGFVPYQPATGEPPTSNSHDATYFSESTTNEQAYTHTSTNGTGEIVFEVQDGVDAPHLGCGVTDSAQDEPQRCWLVIVPRGEHEPNGSVPVGTTGLHTSPLAASNWANRLVVPLDFAPVGEYCDIGEEQRRAGGSEMLEEAMLAWGPALCTDVGTSYNYSPQDDEAARQRAAEAEGDSAGLAFVSEPLVVPPGTGAPVHAPVAVSGLTIGYHIEDPNGDLYKDLRLTPRLIAKLLTHSYQIDVPGGLDRAYLAHNAEALTCDPEFTDLNPEIADPLSNCRGPEGLMVPQGSADSYRMLWRWIQSDPEARAFLDGEPDEWGMRVNPYSQELNLDQQLPAPGSIAFPKPDPSTAKPFGNPVEMPDDAVYGQQDLRPYVESLHDAGEHVLRADSGAKTTWSTSSIPHRLGSDGPQEPGQRFMLGLADVATAARYGLQTAELPALGGRSFVGPTQEALLNGVAAMKPGQAAPGVLEPNFSATGANQAYPLTSVIYGAASTGLPRAAREEYAALITYAAGDGQEQGIGNGLLPPGYAPLPDNLREQARSAAEQLIAGVVDEPDGPDAPGGDPSGGGSGDPGGFTSGAAGPSSGGSLGASGGDDGASGQPSGGPDGSGGNDGRNGGPGGDDGPGDDTVAQTGASTPEQILGIVRWVLLVALVTGIVGTIAGPLLIRKGIIRPPTKRTPTGTTTIEEGRTA